MQATIDTYYLQPPPRDLELAAARIRLMGMNGTIIELTADV